MGRYQVARPRNLTVEQVCIVVRHLHAHVHSLTEFGYLLGVFLL